MSDKTVKKVQINGVVYSIDTDALSVVTFCNNLKTTLPTALASAGISGIAIASDGTVIYNAN